MISDLIHSTIIQGAGIYPVIKRISRLYQKYLQERARGERWVITKPAFLLGVVKKILAKTGG